MGTKKLTQFPFKCGCQFNTIGGTIGKTPPIRILLKLQGAENMNNFWVGVGDLYVTVYGGRTRLVGILLGRGMNIDEAKAELAGVTLESLVVAERVAKAVRVKAEKGLVNLREFPLLMHIDEIITQKKPVNIPWESFTYTEKI